MPYKKGTSGNINGRKRGTPNKITQLQRDFIQSLLDKQQDKITKELSALKGKEYIAAISGLLEFTIPKLNRTEMRATTETGTKQVFIVAGQEIEF